MSDFRRSCRASVNRFEGGMEWHGEKTDDQSRSPGATSFFKRCESIILEADGRLRQEVNRANLKTMSLILSVVLLFSAAVGGYILATDSYLWSVATTHAYGLLAFTVIDVALVAGLWRKPRVAIVAATLLGLVQLGAMSGDIFFGTMTFSSDVTTAAAFSKYLLGDVAFVTLLGIQAVLIIVGIAAFVSWRRAPAVIREVAGT